MKISNLFNTEDLDLISKHNDNAHEEVDMTILDLYRLINLVEEIIFEEEEKYEYSENLKQSEMVEVIRYNQKQAIELLRKRLSKDLREYFYNTDLRENNGSSDNH